MEGTEQKKRVIPTNIYVGAQGGASIGDLRHLAKAHPEEFVQKTQKLIDNDKLRWSDIKDLRAFFRNFNDIQVKTYVDLLGSRAPVMSSAFPVLAGGLTAAEINRSYASVPTIGEQLVDDFEDNKKITTMAAITTMDKSTERVEEGQPFPEIGAGEEKVEIRHLRNGRRLTITAETIEENDVAGFVQKCNALGKIAGKWIEKQTLSRVCDQYGSNTTSAAEPYVYRPNGAGTALYSSTANTPGTRAPSGNRNDNNALNDYSDLDNAKTLLKSMLDSDGDRIDIPINQCILLVPEALEGIASTILNSILVPGEENRHNNWGPRGNFRPRILSSARMDDISTTAWYLGMFKEQFHRKWKLAMEYVTLSGDTQKFLESRIAFQARIAWDCEVGASDYVWVVQNLAEATF